MDNAGGENRVIKWYLKQPLKVHLISWRREWEEYLNSLMLRIGHNPGHMVYHVVIHWIIQIIFPVMHYTKSCAPAKYNLHLGSGIYQPLTFPVMILLHVFKKLYDGRTANLFLEKFSR